MKAGGLSGVKYLNQQPRDCFRVAQAIYFLRIFRPANCPALPGNPIYVKLLVLCLRVEYNSVNFTIRNNS